MPGGVEVPVGPLASLAKAHLERFAQSPEDDSLGSNSDAGQNLAKCAPPAAPPRRRAGAARRDAKRAVDLLLPLAEAWGSGDAPLAFDHIALCSDQFIVTLEHGEKGGFECRFSAPETEDLTDEEYSRRIGDSLPPDSPDEFPEP